MSEQHMHGRVAVITGASAGIGLALAERLVGNGYRVVLNARREEKLREIAERLSAGKGEDVAAVVAGDAADVVVIEAMLDEPGRVFGVEADTVVVNAGRGLAGSVVTSDTGQWEEVVRTNIVGASHLMRSAARRMSERADLEGWPGKGSGDIVVLGSTVGRHISPFSSMYGSTKFAINSLAEALRREVAPKGIRVSLIEPGIVRSEFQGVAGYEREKFEAFMESIGPVLEPDDVARTIAFILEQPPHVLVNDVVIRPTRQEYP